MMQNINIIFIILSIIFIHCITDSKDVPSINTLGDEFDLEFLNNFKNSSEKDVLYDHFPYFLYIYPELVKKRPIIDTFLRRLNVEDEPSRAYILLLIWHRKLNGKTLNIDELLKYVNSDDFTKNCKNLRNINAVFNFRKLNADEDIYMRFSIRNESNINSTVYYLCPILDWKFDDSKDLMVYGKLINKYINPETKEFYIQVKIKDLNRKDVLYFFKRI